jgi:hypothetical protein
LEFRRSTFWQKSLAINILISILLTYLALNLVAIGWFMDIIIREQFQGADIVLKYTEFVFYYLTIDLLGRFVLQDVPILTVSPYLHLPIRRTKLFDYLLFRSLFNFFNLVPLLLMLPFFVKVVFTQLEGSAFVWLTGILLLVLLSNYLTFFLKKIFSVKPMVSLIFLALIGLIFYLDYSDNLSVSEAFGSLFFEIINNPIYLIVPGIVVFGVYLGDRGLMARYIYHEPKVKYLGRRYALSDSFSFLSRLGVTGTLIMLEIRLIFRNARPRTLAIMSVLMILYGLLVFQEGMEVGYGFLLIPSFMITGLFMLSHGQLVIAWDSSHFDFLLVNNVSSYDILKSKYQFFLGANTLFFICSLPYGLFGNIIFLVNTSMYLFNTGVTVYILLLLGVYNTKRVDLTKSAFMNYQGFSGMTYLAILPAMALPFLLFWPFSALGFPYLGFVFLAVIGAIGIALSGILIQKLATRLTSRKYIMSAGFRND